MRESLHPQARAVLQEIEAAGFQASGPATLAEMRRLQEIEPRFSGDPQPVKAIRDLVIDGPGGAVPVRVYTPDSPPPRPAVLFTHGGGWALGGIDFSDPLCRALCRASGMVIASIGYRLAPEHPFPAGLEDAYAALQWLEANAPSWGACPDAFAVCGDSAGGNLATALAIMSRDRGGPRVALQVMIYPALDPTLSLPSFDSCGTGYGLTRDDMRLFWDMYLQAPGDVTHPYASPLEAKSLGGLPPALILIAEFDPLADEAEAYAGKLRGADVAAHVIRYPGMIHGFIEYLGGVDAAHVAVADCAAALRTAMGELPTAT